MLVLEVSSNPMIRVEVQAENSGIRESDFEEPVQDRSPVS
jgi:hypothetical protein